MIFEKIRFYCLAKPGVEECFPFDESTLVFKVLGKMFLITDLNNTTAITVKCDSEKAIELRERYSEIQPGYHTNKKYWNTIALNGNLSDDFLIEMIHHSYEEVVKKMPKHSQQKISTL